ncbi:NUDIX hydrolase [Luedemannella helvata]|uniref:NUDIX hydrolase n=1 Tax=Luedemannella helvata TaxID=349315 RepID=A0ABN2L1U4_9ACTN
MTDPRPIRAAGGVLVRDGLVALVHRPRYDDWTLPKGKAHRGEAPLVTACREVWEETGVRPVPQRYLTTASYAVGTAAGPARKTVDYWTMAPGGETGFTPGDEIDEVAWLAPPAAGARLSYAHDIAVLEAYRSAPAHTGVVILLRHATAGRRGDVAGADSERPLDAAGRARAEALRAPLDWYGPHRLVSASPVRCLQTLGPLASTLELPVEVDPAFDEAADPVSAASRVRALAGGGRSTVVCSQGGLLPPLLGELTGRRVDDFATDKGAGWEVGFAAGGAVVVDRLRA